MEGVFLNKALCLHYYCDESFEFAKLHTADFVCDQYINLNILCCYLTCAYLFSVSIILLKIILHKTHIA